jgi:hypothetical protein
MKILPLSETVPNDDYLLFVPVPVKPRHNGWSPIRQRAFIMALTHIGCVKLAAASVGKSRQSAYNLKKRDDAASFGLAWDRALECGEHNVMDHGIERALYGEERQHFYRGQLIGTSRKFDNGILRAALAVMDRKAALDDRQSRLKENNPQTGE